MANLHNHFLEVSCSYILYLGRYQFSLSAYFSYLFQLVVHRTSNALENWSSVLSGDYVWFVVVAKMVLHYHVQYFLLYNSCGGIRCVLCLQELWLSYFHVEHWHGSHHCCLLLVEQPMCFHQMTHYIFYTSPFLPVYIHYTLHEQKRKENRVV